MSPFVMITPISELSGLSLPDNLEMDDYVVGTLDCGFWARCHPKPPQVATYIQLQPIQPHPDLGLLLSQFMSHVQSEIVHFSLILDLYSTTAYELQTYIHIGFVQPVWMPDVGQIRLDTSSSISPYQGVDQAEFILNAQQLLVQVSGRIKRFKLDRSDIATLYARLYDHKEWSCCWTKTGLNDLSILDSSWRSARDNYDPEQTNNQSFNVSVSKATKYSCHTHPLIGYLAIGLLFASPSTLDFTSCLRYYRDYRFHFVATMEGLYQIEYTPHTRLLMLFLEQNNPTCFESFITLFQLYVSNQRIFYAREAFQDLAEMDLEATREKIYQVETLYRQGLFHSHDVDPIRTKGIQQYLAYINRASVYDLLYFTPTRYHSFTVEQQTDLVNEQSRLIQCLAQFIYADFNTFRLCYFRYISWPELESHPYVEAIDYDKVEYAPFIALKSG